MEEQQTYTAFGGPQKIASGSRTAIIEALRAWVKERGEAGVLVFDDRTGKQIDLPLRDGAEAAVPAETRTGPGRPKLGVVSREVSLLPRHWEWLEDQPNGASAALRRLVDQARQAPENQAKQARQAAGRFLLAMAGNFAGYEEATRALYAGDMERLRALTADWPAEIRAHALALAESRG